MGRKNWKLEGEQECSAKKSDCLEEQEVRKLNDHEVKENREKKIFFTASNQDKVYAKNKRDETNYPKSRNEQLINHPSDWTTDKLSLPSGVC